MGLLDFLRSFFGVGQKKSNGENGDESDKHYVHTVSTQQKHSSTLEMPDQREGAVERERKRHEVRLSSADEEYRGSQISQKQKQAYHARNVTKKLRGSRNPDEMRNKGRATTAAVTPAPWDQEAEMAKYDEKMKRLRADVLMAEKADASRFAGVSMEDHYLYHPTRKPADIDIWVPATDVPPDAVFFPPPRAPTLQYVQPILNQLSESRKKMAATKLSTADINDTKRERPQGAKDDRDEEEDSHFAKLSAEQQDFVRAHRKRLRQYAGYDTPLDPQAVALANAEERDERLPIDASIMELHAGLRIGYWMLETRSLSRSTLRPVQTNMTNAGGVPTAGEVSSTKLGGPSEAFHRLPKDHVFTIDDLHRAGTMWVSLEQNDDLSSIQSNHTVSSPVAAQLKKGDLIVLYFNGDPAKKQKHRLEQNEDRWKMRGNIANSTYQQREDQAERATSEDRSLHSQLHQEKVSRENSRNDEQIRDKEESMSYQTNTNLKKPFVRNFFSPPHMPGFVGTARVLDVMSSDGTIHDGHDIERRLRHGEVRHVQLQYVDTWKTKLTAKILAESERDSAPDQSLHQNNVNPDLSDELSAVLQKLNQEWKQAQSVTSEQGRGKELPIYIHRIRRDDYLHLCALGRHIYGNPYYVNEKIEKELRDAGIQRKEEPLVLDSGDTLPFPKAAWAYPTAPPTPIPTLDPEMTELILMINEVRNDQEKDFPRIDAYTGRTLDPEDPRYPWYTFAEGLIVTQPPPPPPNLHLHAFVRLYTNFITS